MRAAILSFATITTLSSAAEPIVLTVHDRSIGVIPHEFQGIMAERTRFQFDERGLEAGWDQEMRDWRPDLVHLTQALSPAWLRYPGGGEADRSDWRWGITHAPGRWPGRLAQDEGGDRYTTHHAGTDEFLALCRAVSAEPVLVVNVAGYRDAPEVGAEIAAAWVEYCNAPNDGSNPGGGIEWASVRAANGHPDPHGVTQWELGNEVWMPPLEMEPAEYGEAIRHYAEAMLDVDPRIEFTAMGQDGRWARASIAGVGDSLRWLSLHSYSLWEISEPDVTSEEIWAAAFMGPPDHFHEQVDETWEAVLATGRQDEVRISINEWNCNAWIAGEGTPQDMPQIQALGAVVYYHELVRRTEQIGQACLSMLVGTSWPNAVIRVDEQRVKPRPFHPALSSLWAGLRGDIMALTLEGCPELNLERQIGNIPPRTKPAIDAVASHSGQMASISVVNGDATAIEVIVRFENPCTPSGPPDRMTSLIGSAEIAARRGSDWAVGLGPHSATLLTWGSAD